MALNHQWTGESATLNYTYDRTGLQTSYSSTDDRFAPLFEGLGTKTNTPNNLNQYITAAGFSLTYDGNGNLTGDGTRTYSYDAANRLMTAQAGHEANYAYDPFDRRSAKSVDGQAKSYIYDGNQIIAEYGASELVKKFVYGPSIDEPIMMESGPDRYYYNANTLGSIVSLTNSTGNVVEAYRYSVYGQVDHSGSIGNPYLFTGREFDSETGLYYYRARYYDAGLRRFLQVDPIGFAGGMNLYAYVGNNPGNWVDPLGLSVWKKGFNVIRAFGKSRHVVTKNIKGKNVEDVAKKISGSLDSIDLRTGARRVVEAPDEKSRDALSKALSSDGKQRGPEQSGGGYPQHTHPNQGRFEDVHIESILLPALVPYSFAIRGNEEVEPNDIIAAASWDIASTLDPFFITDILEWLFDFDASIYGSSINCGKE